MYRERQSLVDVAKHLGIGVTDVLRLPYDETTLYLCLMNADRMASNLYSREYDQYLDRKK